MEYVEGVRARRRRAGDRAIGTWCSGSSTPSCGRGRRLHRAGVVVDVLGSWARSQVEGVVEGVGSGGLGCSGRGLRLRSVEGVPGRGACSARRLHRAGVLVEGGSGSSRSCGAGRTGRQLRLRYPSRCCGESGGRGSARRPARGRAVVSGGCGSAIRRGWCGRARLRLRRVRFRLALILSRVRARSRGRGRIRSDCQPLYIIDVMSLH